MKNTNLLWASASLCVAIQTAHAEERIINFNIPAQSAATALDAWAAQSDMQMLFNRESLKNSATPGVVGQLTAHEALQKLLAGTGLTYTFTANDAVAVKVAESGSNAASTLPAVKVLGKGVYDSNDPNNPDYHRSNASTATKTDAPIMETPYSVSVVPQQVLKDQQFIRVEDAISNVAGIQPNFTNGGLEDSFMVRGFQSASFFRDGILLPSGFGSGNTKRETANIDRIEVLKGPGSILYGRSEPGGVINMVTKRPQATSYNSIQQQFGSYDRYRTAVDSTGKITKDDELLYRVNLSYENANSFRDFVKTDSFFIAPSFTWNISDRTQANLDIEYQHRDNTMDGGIPPIGNRPAPVPISRQLADPFNNKSIGDRTYVGFNWSHAFNDKWKLNHRISAEFFDEDQNFTFFFKPATATGDIQNNNGRGFSKNMRQQQNYYTTLNLTGKFDTAMLEHTILGGFDYFVVENQGAQTCCRAFPAGNFNIFNPTYQTAESITTLTPNPDRSQEWYGLYFQDQIKFPFNVYGNVGLRYDNATGRNDTKGIITTQEDRVSPRGGLLWRPLNWLSVYGNYSENFGPSNSFFTPKALPPQTAQEWELGAKTEFMDGRISATFAYFDLTKQNLAVTDPTNPNLQRAIGEQESRGYEFEVAGEVLPGWRVIGAYTHLPYAVINKDVGFNGGIGNTGHRMFNTPRNYGSLWNTYEFQYADLRGLKIGGGVIAAGQSQGDNENDYQLPGYATVNLLASYGLNVAGKKLTFQLNANNLLDKTYYPGSNSGYTIGVGSPRTFLGSVKLEF